MTHLDTSFLVDLLREAGRGKEGPATGVLDELADEELAVSVHVVCELQAGAELSDDPEQERARVGELLSHLALAIPDARFPPVYGRLLAELRGRGERVPTMDLLIGTSAIVQRAPLVTRNAADFDRIPGLQVISY